MTKELSQKVIESIGHGTIEVYDESHTLISRETYEEGELVEMEMEDDILEDLNYDEDNYKDYDHHAVINFQGDRDAFVLILIKAGYEVCYETRRHESENNVTITSHLIHYR